MKDTPTPTPEQQTRIDALRIEIEDAYLKAGENKRIPTIEGLFDHAPEGDFHWESDPEDCLARLITFAFVPSSFAGWAHYDLDCAETGEDPLENWRRPFTTEDAIKSAERNLAYLRM